MKFLCLFLILMFLGGCRSNNDLVINGNTVGINDSKVYLTKFNGRDYQQQDSTYLKNGHFKLEVRKVVYPEQLYISLGDYNIPFISEKGTLNIDVDIDNSKVKISGTPSNDLVDIYRTEDISLSNKLDSLIILRDLYIYWNDTLNQQRLNSEIQRISVHRKTVLEDLIRKNSGNYGAAYILSESDTYGFSYTQVDSLINLLSHVLPDNAFSRKLINRRNILFSVSKWQEMQDFTLFSPEGERVNLSSYTGNYLILDFWAPGYSESERINRNYKSIYGKYHNQGVEIISVYVGRDLDEWRNSITENNYNWKHLSQLRGWDSDILKKYGVIALPHNVIIDPDGKIIDNLVFGHDLELLLENEFTKDNNIELPDIVD